MCTTTLELKTYESLCVSTTPPVQLAYTQHEPASSPVQATGPSQKSKLRTHEACLVRTIESENTTQFAKQTENL
jgi:hypothetical protein